jgi:hypothetical protein
MVGATVFRHTVSISVLERHPQVVAFLDESGMDLGELREAIDDVVDVLQAAVSGVSEDRFASIRKDPDRQGDNESESEDDARSKFRLVASTFDLEDLRRRNWIKRTSKNHLLGELRWEVVVKRSDLELEAPTSEGVPYGLVKLRSETPDRFSVFGDASAELTFAVDEEDVSYLIAALETLRADLLGAMTTSN